MPTDHAIYSPSDAKNWELCPGKAQFCAAHPEPEGATPNPASLLGTRTHQLMEVCLTKPCRPEEVTSLVDDYGDAFDVTDEMRSVVNQYIDYLVSRQDEVGGPMALRVETRVDAGPLLLDSGATGHVWGTSDSILVWEDVLEVVDLKNGRRYVSEKDNWQMLVYAAGALVEYWDPNTQSYPFRVLRTTIVQPRAEGEPVRWAEYDLTGNDPSRPSFWLAIEPIKRALAEAMREDAPRVPGDRQCYFCSGKSHCPEHQSWIAEKRGISFGPVGQADQQPKPMEETPMTTNIDAPQIALPAIHMGEDGRPTTESLLTMVAFAQELRDALKSLEPYEEEAVRRAQEEGVPKGWTLKPGRRIREWAIRSNESPAERDERLKKYLSRLKTVNGEALGVDAVAPRKLISPAALLRREDLPEPTVQRLTEKFIAVKEGKPKLVRASAPPVEFEPVPAQPVTPPEPQPEAGEAEPQGEQMPLSFL